MHKLNRFVFTYLLTATAIVGWSNFLTHRTIAQTIQQQEISQNNDPPVDEKEGGRTGRGTRFTSASLSCYPNFFQT
jgi:hypothetical protein